jgi:hypothetical protein
MARFPMLKKRGKVWYFRKVIPANLRGSLQGPLADQCRKCSTRFVLLR